MYKKIQILLGVAVAAVALQTTPSVAADCYYDCSCGSSCGKAKKSHVPCYMKPKQRAQNYNWHANYAHSAYGQPIALVVPPTANMQTTWGWGAPSAHFSHLDHQFGRDYPGPGPFGGSFNNTPHWPQNTHQFGVYYVRGPWYPTQR